MTSKPTKDVIIYFSIPFRIAILLITLAALLVCIPLAVQTIPKEAFGNLFALVLFPSVLVYGSFFVFTYQIQIKDDRIAAEAVPNPLAPSFQCNYADISRIENGSSCIHLDLYRFRKAEPYRISNMNLLEGGPVRVLEEIYQSVPEDKIGYRIPKAFYRWLNWYSLLTGTMLLLGACVFSITLLDANGFLAFVPIHWNTVQIFTYAAIFILMIPAWLILRRMDSKLE